MDLSLFLQPEKLSEYDLICSGALLDAMIIVADEKKEECQHSFCKSCIQEWYPSHNTCPICRMLIKSTFPDMKSRRKLQGQLVKCPLWKEGCTDTFALAELTSHSKRCLVLPNCPFFLFGCDFKGTDLEIEQHMQNLDSDSVHLQLLRNRILVRTRLTWFLFSQRLIRNQNPWQSKNSICSD